METTILNIGNHYGDLQIFKDDSGKTSWAISGSEHDEEHIPEYLYDAIIKYYQEYEAETEEYVKMLRLKGFEIVTHCPGFILSKKGDVLIQIWTTRNTYEVFINGELAIQNAGTPISEQKISELIEQMEMFN